MKRGIVGLETESNGFYMGWEGTSKEVPFSKYVFPTHCSQLANEQLTWNFGKIAAEFQCKSGQ